MTALPLSGLSLGYLVGQPTAPVERYRVHSSFSHAVNLSVSPGRLLTLLGAEASNQPLAIRLATPSGWDWRQHLRPGQMLDFHPWQLIGNGWCADLRQACRWLPTELVGTPASQLHALSHYPHLARQLHREARLRIPDSPLQLLPGWPETGRLPHFELCHSRERIADQVGQLVGYGCGLTPSGDDYLLGYLVALAPWRRHAEMATHLQWLHAAIDLKLQGTTDISRHYLALGLQGHFSQALHQLMQALLTLAPPATVESCAEQLMRYGATSGMDTLAGLLHGLRTLRQMTSEPNSILKGNDNEDNT